MPIAECTTTKLSESVGYLEALYRPLVRGSRRRRDSNHDGDLRSDAFERTYAIRWLTALISRLDPISNDTQHDHDRLIQQATSLLATCAGVAASGRVHRQFVFQLSLPSLACIDSSSPIPIHVTLTDIPLDNHDYGSVGAQTWGGACVLAELIAERPDRFGLHPLRTPLRILELGAGTGLVGLTVAKVLQVLRSLHPTTRHHDIQATTIVLTDIYPAVLANLQSNINANCCPTTHDDPDASGGTDTIRIASHPLDWPDVTRRFLPFSTPFDLVFGADIIYEAQHAVWIRDCLQSLLIHPCDAANKTAAFHLVIPQRPTHTFESGTVEEVFGHTKVHCEGSTSPQELVIFEKELIVCEAYADGGSGRRCADEDVEYVYYRIGWSH
ncbi:hypothetical protein JVU11DRAFT_4083 [Chiua virens]|nr:hypothetical protein JVU11DRAFT_4083 [Chiua virens]